MTKKGKLTIEMSGKRQRLNELLALDELTAEQRAEMGTLSTRLQELEVELRAAIIEEETREVRIQGTPEARELRELVARCNLGAIFQAALEHRAVDGPEREIQEHYNLQGNQFPVALLETRAVTPAPSNVGQNQAPIIPGVFPMSCAAFLGVDMPRVGVGEAVYPVLTTSATAHTPAENAPAAETTGAFTAEVLSPSRIQASFFYSREDRARFAGMDMALRMNLSDALADKLDQQIINGTNGLLNGTNLDNHNVNTETDFAGYRDTFAYGRVDGKYAGSVSDLRIVMGQGTYAHAATAYRSNNADDSALNILMSVTSGVKVSAHVPAVASSKQNNVIRLGMRRDMVAPIWEGVTLIPDEVTKAGTGEIVITAVMLHAIKIVRKAGFYKQQVQVA